MNVQEVLAYYEGLAKRSLAVVAEHGKAKEQGEALTRAHNFLGDYASLQTALKNHYIAPCVGYAISEYQFAIFLASIGAYRSAFSVLRLSFELMLAAIWFSTNEVHFREWKKGQRELNWKSLVDEETGIFSKNFVKAFFDDLADEGPAFRSLAATVYRECSEFVHGNYKTHRGDAPPFRFDGDIFARWIEKADNMHFVIMFAFTARFLLDLGDEEKSALQELILDSLGHFEPVREQFGKAK